MFSVLEYNKSDGSFIDHTFCYDGKSAIRLSKLITEEYEDIKVIVTELDYNEHGLLWECVIWNSERQ